ncbi:hypothetical protein [Chryseobacterium sp. c4a]|uniref:hypothetical protein n=1 Tax=Chryseobacterium sp. c4a TaxID=1573582 RepID=UPI00135A0AE2|nr:hypothetical protein [Chryseobacterium sp. c4a]
MRKSLFFIALWAYLMGSKLCAQVGVNTPNPTSSLTVNGSFAATYKTVSSSGAVGANDYYIAYNSVNNGTLTLPAAINGTGNFGGRTYHFKNTGTGNLVIAAAGAELIDDQNGAGVSTLSIPIGYYAFLVNKGTTTGTTWELVLFSSSNTMPSSENTYPFATKATDVRQSCDATPNPSAPWIRTAIVYQNTILNKGGVLTPSTGAFKAPNDGYYVINGSTQFDNGGMTAPPPTFTWTTLYLIKNYAPNNGGTILVQSYQPTATVVFGSSVSCMTYLNAGDTVTMASVAGVSNGSKYEVVTSSMYGYKIAN